MPKKVLLPIKGNGFSTAGGANGWSLITNGNLHDISEDVIGKPSSEDHAIPSLIAHLKHFRHKLNNGDIDAINEWRGMLAVIALQKVKNLNITIKDIPIYPDSVTGSPTSLGTVLFDELYSNSDITGYDYLKDATGQYILQDGKKTPVYKTFSVFCLNGIPFAMFMPSMLICPFKAYPENLFADLDWYSDSDIEHKPNNDPKGKWKSVLKFLQYDQNTMPVTAQKFYFWLKGIYSSHKIHLIDNFIDELLLPNYQTPTSDNELMPITKIYLEDGKTSGDNVFDALKTVCPFPEIIPFSDNILFVVPQSGLFTNVTPDKKDYRICTDNSGVPNGTPKSIKIDNNTVFVIPPFHNDVLNYIKDNQASILNWNVVKKGETYECMLELNFKKHGKTIYYKNFSQAQIAYTECMPYISMWPYVNFSDDSWKEHYVAIIANNFGLGGSQLDNYKTLKNYTHIIGKTDIKGTPEIKIDLVAKNNEAKIDVYNSESNYHEADSTENQKIKLLASSSEPFALEFSYFNPNSNKFHSLGSWIIDRTKGESRKISPIAGRKACIAMDFGTTSTNIYLSDANGTRSISSPGKYLYNIYNPYVNCKTDGIIDSSKSDFIQNYFLFSSSDKELGKIFTYGQNFSSKKNNVSLGGDIVSNASGRMVVVDENFILNGTIGNKSEIWNGLKLKPGTVNPCIKTATDNFICNILTYAVLEAKESGATDIEIRVSYPSENYGATVKNSISKLAGSIATKSNINITVTGTTEARAAGEYFYKAPGVTSRPTPSTGYAIIDIGGGTTDFSFWRGNPIPQLKSEYSFGYAGNYLVERTMIQGINANFASIWRYDDSDENSVVAKAIKKYNGVGSTKPITFNPTQEYYQKLATIDFLLENGEINYGELCSSSLNRFLSAIRMKYYSLFYLVASFIKKQIDKNIIELSDTSFRICLAGCGAKGMEIARTGSLGANFDSNIEMIFKATLELPEDNYSFKILSPINDNKEEVVIGLTLVSDGSLKAVSKGTTNSKPAKTLKPWMKPAANTNNVDSDSEEDKLVELSLDDAKNAYTELLEWLVWFEYHSDDGEEAYRDGTSLVDLIDIDMSNEARSFFIEEFSIVKDVLDSSNPNPDTYAENFALLMLENMIDQFI